MGHHGPEHSDAHLSNVVPALAGVKGPITRELPVLEAADTPVPDNWVDEATSASTSKGKAMQSFASTREPVRFWSAPAFAATLGASAVTFLFSAVLAVPAYSLTPDSPGLPLTSQASSAGQMAYCFMGRHHHPADTVFPPCRR
jgi:hypothetical protein